MDAVDANAQLHHLLARSRHFRPTRPRRRGGLNRLAGCCRTGCCAMSCSGACGNTGAGCDAAVTRFGGEGAVWANWAALAFTAASSQFIIAARVFRASATAGNERKMTHWTVTLRSIVWLPPSSGSRRFPTSFYSVAFPTSFGFPRLLSSTVLGSHRWTEKCFGMCRGQPIEYRFSANTQIVDTFQRRSADPANHRVAIAAHQRIGHRPLTYRTIPFNRTLTSGHTAIMERRKPPRPAPLRKLTATH